MTLRRTAPRPTTTRSRKKRLTKDAYHHGDLARAIVDSALALIAERGLEGLTLREAAARVGVSHVAVYNHFRDKRALSAAIAEQGFTALATEFDLARSGSLAAGPRAVVEAMARAFARFAFEESPRFAVMAGPRLNEDGAFPALEAAVDRCVRALEAALGAMAIAAGRSTPRPRDLALAFFSFGHGYVALVRDRRIRVRSSELAARHFLELLAPFLDGIAHPS